MNKIKPNKREKGIEGGFSAIVAEKFCFFIIFNLSIIICHNGRKDNIMCYI